MRLGLRIWVGVVVLLLGLMLGACGGGDSPPTLSASTETLSGVAATGAAVHGTVSLKDIPTGQVQATHTDNGAYAFNVTGLAGPFLLRVQSDDHATTLYSVVLKSGKTTRGHINPLSNLVVARITSRAPFTGTTNLPAIYDNPTPLDGLTPTQLYDAIHWVLEHTSPYFRQRLVAHGQDVDIINPVSDAFVIGEGLDRAFDDVLFFFDAENGEAWEKSVATGEIVGASKFFPGVEDPSTFRFTLSAPSDYLIPEASQTLHAELGWDWISPLPIGKGVRWELSDDSLVSIDEAGVITAKAFSGTHTVTVTGHYQHGDIHLQDSLTLTLTDVAQVASVDMSGLPDELQAVSEYPLYTTVHLTEEAGGETLQVYQAQWSLVNPDEASSNGVSLGSINGIPYLLTRQPAEDISVRLRAVQNIRGFTYITEKTVMVKKFVLTPVSMSMLCPYSIEYATPASCRADVRYNNGTSAWVEPTLSVSVEDAPYVALAGNTLTSGWDNKVDYRSIQVTGTIATLSNTQTITLSPRKTLLIGLELVGMSELAEGTSTVLQAWATWDDGTRTDISSAMRWTSSDTARAKFNQYASGSLYASYIVDEPGDKEVVITASACKYREEWSCTDVNRMTASTTITVHYTPLALTGLRVDTGATGYAFMQQGSSYHLTARAIWNKKLPDNSDYSTEVSDGVQWSSDHSGVAISGSLLTVGTTGSESLALLTASYQDPSDSNVIRTARRVVTLFSPPATPRYLRYAESYTNGGGSTYLLGGDGLARRLQSFSSPYRRGVGKPDPFISRVKQVVRTHHGQAYLRDDGTVWYPELINGLPYSQEMRDQLSAQIGEFDYLSVLPRPIPGLTNVVMLAETAFNPFVGGFFALKEDGSVVQVAVFQHSGMSTTTYTLTPGILSGAKHLVGGINLLLALKHDGTVWSRGTSGLGRDGSGDYFGQVVKADQTPLTSIVAIAMLPNGGMALDQQGNLWTWGDNFWGQLGFGDTVARPYATRISSVTGFSRIAPNMSAGLRSDGSLWSWGSPNMYNNKEPQRVDTFTGLTQLQGGHVVQADGSVWWWGRDLDLDNQSTPMPVHPEHESEGEQLILR